MEDTFFFVPDEKRSRLAAQYQRNESGALVMFRARGQEEQRNNFFSGGGGLRSTVGDYRFVVLLRGEGLAITLPRYG